MKRIVRILPILTVLAALAGCGGGVSVNYDYDNNVDFADYRSFAWMPRSSEAPADAMEARTGGDLLDRRIRNSVDGELSARGLAQVSTDPDLLVIYHVGAQEKVQVTDWGYNYSDYYWGYGGRQIDVHQFTEGTLVIDLVDAASTNLVWRGSGTGVVSTQQRSPEEMQARMNDVVAEILKSFPPK